MDEQSLTTAWLGGVELSTGSFILPSSSMIAQTLSIDAASGQHRIKFTYRCNGNDVLEVYVSQHNRSVLEIFESIIPTQDCESIRAMCDSGNLVGLMVLGDQQKEVHLRIGDHCEATLIQALHNMNYPEISFQSYGAVAYRSSNFPLKSSFESLLNKNHNEYTFLLVHSATFAFYSKNISQLI